MKAPYNLSLTCKGYYRRTKNYGVRVINDDRNDPQQLILGREQAIDRIRRTSSENLSFSAPTVPTQVRRTSEFPDIDLIGVELEGLWHNLPLPHQVHDASVRVACNHPIAGGFCGETRIGPLSVDDALAEMQSRYPNHVNQSCGLHVHMSFTTPGATASLICKEFTDFLVAQLQSYARDNHPRKRNFFARLDGANYYCRPVYCATCPRCDRYRAVNYAALNRHGTIEIRVLPAFESARWACAAVQFVAQTTQTWLSHNAPAQGEPRIVARWEEEVTA